MTDGITIIENNHREIERLFDAYRTGPAATQDDTMLAGPLASVADRIRDLVER